MRRAWLVAFVFLWAACASRVRVPSPSRSIDDRLAKADAEPRAGCFDCLVEAPTIYEQLAGADVRARRGVAEAAGLLAIRERALGLPDLHYLERARQTDTDSSNAVLFDGREQQIDANGELRARARALLARIKPPE
jgi:hypothetical protein